MSVRTKTKTRLAFSKTGLVCSGGATKAAAFHVGVCLALRDKGFTFLGGKATEPAPVNTIAYPRPNRPPQEIGTYVGSSAGALIACLLAAGVSAESLINSLSENSDLSIPGNHPVLPKITYRDMLAINWMKPAQILRNFKQSPLFGRTIESLFLKNLRLPGLFSTRGLAAYLQKNVLPTNDFSELQADLFVVGTQLDHSRKVIFGRYSTGKVFDTYSQYSSNASISDAVAASMSLPPIYAPYPINHPGDKQRYYIDGEIRETLSTHVAKDNGCDLIICSYTHQPYHFKPEIGSLFNYGLAAIIIQTVYQAIEQKVYGARKVHENKVLALETVKKFFAEKKYPKEDLEELSQRLRTALDFKETLNYIFIHPEPRDREMFFGDHFTLDAQSLQNVVSIGYRRGIAELRRYDFTPVAAK